MEPKPEWWSASGAIGLDADAKEKGAGPDGSMAKKRRLVVKNLVPTEGCTGGELVDAVGKRRRPVSQRSFGSLTGTSTRNTRKPFARSQWSSSGAPSLMLSWTPKMPCCASSKAPKANRKSAKIGKCKNVTFELNFTCLSAPASVKNRRQNIEAQKAKEKAKIENEKKQLAEEQRRRQMREADAKRMKGKGGKLGKGAGKGYKDGVGRQGYKDGIVAFSRKGKESLRAKDPATAFFRRAWSEQLRKFPRRHQIALRTPSGRANVCGHAPPPGVELEVRGTL